MTTIPTKPSPKALAALSANVSPNATPIDRDAYQRAQRLVATLADQAYMLAPSRRVGDYLNTLIGVLHDTLVGRNDATITRALGHMPPPATSPTCLVRVDETTVDVASLDAARFVASHLPGEQVTITEIHPGNIGAPLITYRRPTPLPDQPHYTSYNPHPDTDLFDHDAEAPLVANAEQAREDALAMFAATILGDFKSEPYVSVMDALGAWRGSIIDQGQHYDSDILTAHGDADAAYLIDKAGGCAYVSRDWPTLYDHDDEPAARIVRITRGHLATATLSEEAFVGTDVVYLDQSTPTTKGIL